MTLRIAPILLAVISSISLYAADDDGVEVRSGDRSAAVDASGDGATIEFVNGIIVSDGRIFLQDRVPTDATLSQNVNRVFRDQEREFPFSPRLIRQRNYDIQIIDESLLSDEFLNDNSAWQERHTADPQSRGSFVVQTAGTEDAFGIIVVDVEGDSINIIRRDADNRPHPVLVDCEGEGACFRRINADDQPIDVVFADCDDDCGAPATAHVPEPPPGLPSDLASAPTPAEIQRTLPPAAAPGFEVLGNPVGFWLQGVDRLDHGFSGRNAGRTSAQGASSAESGTAGGYFIPEIKPIASEAASTASESCSHVEPPLKAKVEHLLEAARHLAGAGYEDEAKLFRVEAEAIQKASTRLLTEKRQELEQLQREITELEELTGQYQMIQINCRIMELSLPTDCEAGAHLEVLQQPGIHVLTGQPCSSDSDMPSRLLTGEELAQALHAIENHPCGALKTLSEPAIVTMNGRPATLRSGGEFPILIPVAAEEGAERRAAIEWKNFGIMMQAVPFILGDGKVRLSLETEIADRDFSNAMTIEGTVVPGVTTSKFRSDIEAQLGETVAIALNSTPQAGGIRSLLVLVTARQIEPPAERREHD